MGRFFRPFGGSLSAVFLLSSKYSWVLQPIPMVYQSLGSVWRDLQDDVKVMKFSRSSWRRTEDVEFFRANHSKVRLIDLSSGTIRHVVPASVCISCCRLVRRNQSDTYLRISYSKCKGGPDILTYFVKSKCREDLARTFMRPGERRKRFSGQSSMRGKKCIVLFSRAMWVAYVWCRSARKSNGVRCVLSINVTQKGNEIDVRWLPPGPQT